MPSGEGEGILDKEENLGSDFLTFDKNVQEVMMVTPTELFVNDNLKPPIDYSIIHQYQQNDQQLQQLNTNNPQVYPKLTFGNFQLICYKPPT